MKLKERKIKREHDRRIEEEGLFFFHQAAIGRDEKLITDLLEYVNFFIIQCYLTSKEFVEPL